VLLAGMQAPGTKRPLTVTYAGARPDVAASSGPVDG